MIKVLSLFSGIGAFEKALEKLNIEHEIVNYCEIDKYASKSYSILHNISEDLNLHDITKIDDLDLLGMPEIDLLTYGFPCTDISLAGYGRGLEYNGQKTRSGLVWDAHHIIDMVRPKIAICENVKNLTSKKFAKEFQAILESLENMGYVNRWKVLNAKDFGVPQNRERVFIVSIRKDIDDGSFKFPQGFPLEIRLKDILDDEVDEKYYLSADNLKWLQKHNEHHLSKGTGFLWKPVDTNGVAHTLRANGSFAPTDNSIVVEPYNETEDGVCRCIKANYYKVSSANLHDKGSTYGATGVVVKTNNAKGYDIAEDGDYINVEHPSSTTRRGRVGHGVCQTLDTSATAHCVVVAEPQVVRLGGIYDTEEKNYQGGSVFDKNGLAPALTTCGGVHRQPIITEEPQVNRLGSYSPSGYKGTAIVGVDGVAPTVMDNHGQVTAIPVAYDEQNQYIRRDGCVGTLTTDGSSPKHNNRIICDGNTTLRIRKLTPYECFALMGFDKSDGYKLSEAKISNTQLYKQAGNSICVPCLEYIYKEIYK